MARVQGPLMSEKAHGSIANKLTFLQQKGLSICKKYKQPIYRKTEKQNIQRTMLRNIILMWQYMTDDDKELWNNKAKEQGYKISGFQLFCSTALKDIYGTTKLTGYWSFNEWDGDYIDNNVGDYTNLQKKTGLEDNYPELVNSFSAKMGKCADLTKPKAYFQGAHDNRINPGLNDFYIEGWIKMPYSSIAQYIFRKLGGGLGGGWNIYSTIGRLYCTLNIGGTAVTFWYNDQIANNTWRKFGLNVDRSGFAKLYLDGIQKGTPYNISGISGLVSPGNNLLINQSFSDNNGYIDEVYVFHRLFSDDEILARYNKDIS